MLLILYSCGVSLVNDFAHKYPLQDSVYHNITKQMSVDTNFNYNENVLDN